MAKLLRGADTGPVLRLPWPSPAKRTHGRRSIWNAPEDEYPARRVYRALEDAGVNGHARRCCPSRREDTDQNRDTNGRARKRWNHRELVGECLLTATVPVDAPPGQRRSTYLLARQCAIQAAVPSLRSQRAHRLENDMKLSVIVMIGAFGAVALTGCTGGNMGDTRGGGAAPGQSGGRDTTHAASPGTTPSAAAAPATTADTTKQRAKAKQP
jgi:hypothetical protein